jgi:hypothetical protein
MDERFESREWCGLLEETRQALSTLRAEDLEELAGRAERAFDTNSRLAPQGAAELGPADRANLTRERRLLGDLILATDRNRAVLRRRCLNADYSPTEGVDQRWAR